MSQKKKKINIIPERTGHAVLLLVTIFAEIVLFMMILLSDILPFSYIMGILAVVILADILLIFLFNNSHEKSGKSIAGIIIAGLLIIIMVGLSFMLANTLDTLNKISGKSGDGMSEIKPFNMYISGIDSRDGMAEYSRSDFNMIVTVNPQTKTVLLTSIPRDSYVPLHMNGEMDKLTHSGVYGIEETLMTVEDWLGIKIDYYAKVDFDMVVELVKAVGGVRVYNNIDFYSHPKGWHFKKGWLDLNGKQALWFARERKSFKDMDEQRIRNQQKVVSSLIKKMTSSKTLLLNYANILNAIEEDMETSMPREMLNSMVKYQLSEMPEWKIKRQSIDGVDAERGTWSMGPNRPLFVSLPKQKSVDSAVRNINKTLNPEEGE